MTAPPPKLRVSIVGAGIIGLNHARAMLRHPRLAVASIVDTDTGARAQLGAWIARETGSPPRLCGTLGDALAAGTDLVVICTPSGTHAVLAEEALAAGRHVVVEKPLDASLVASRRLARAAAEAVRRGQVFSVISQHRFDPASAAVAEAVMSGGLGRITSAVASVAWWRGQDYYDSAGWRGTWADDGGGATMNQGVHTVDLLLWLLGRPVEIFANIATLAHERVEVEDVAVATVRFASGALAVLHATTAAYPGVAVRLAVHGTRGSAVIHDDQLEYLHVANRVGGAPGVPSVTGAVPPMTPTVPPTTGAADRDANQAAVVVPPEHLRGATPASDAFVVGHLRQYSDIVDAIDTHRPAAVGAEDALLAVAVVKAMYASARRHEPVAVDAVLGGAYDDVLAEAEQRAGMRPNKAPT